MIILTGRSASGKTTIARELIERYGFKKFVTHTTRPPRVGEVNHKDYHFVSKEEFEKKKENGDFIETMEYNDNYYGSAKADIGSDKVLIVDVKGANHFSKHVSDDSVFFFITCSDSILEKRMIERGDSKENIAKRLKSDKMLFDKTLMNRIDYIIDTSEVGIDLVTDKVFKLYNEYINAHRK